MHLDILCGFFCSELGLSKLFLSRRAGADGGKEGMGRQLKRVRETERDIKLDKC